MSANRVRRVFVVSIAVALAVLLPGQAPHAQSPLPQAGPGLLDRDFSQDIPAHLAYIEGEVTLERDGKLEPAERNLGLLAGDRLRTRDGRVEILYADGSTLAVDVDTSADLLSDGLVRLLDGSLRVTIPRTKEDFEYRVDTRAASVEIHIAGEYRIDTGVDRRGNANVDLTVIRGTADLVNDHGHTLVRAGQHAVADAASEPSDGFPANSAAFDEFDQWVDDRRASHVTSTATSPSADYLPEEVQYYSSTMDDYGTWGYESSYGAVWYPRVAADWHPYWQGRWSYTPYYGWFWVGIDAWSWPTHHYGSWGLSSGRWYWIPGRAWAPAWVTWYTAPGYVSWCPRGYNGLPVVPFHQTSLYGEPWRTWTTVAANQFRPNMWVTENAIAGNRIPPNVRDEFKERPVPAPVGPATPRRTLEPLRAPTRPKNVTVSNVDGDAGRTFGGGDVRAARTGTTAPPRAIGNTAVGGAVRGDDSRAKAGADPAPRYGAARSDDPRVKAAPEPTQRNGVIRDTDPRLKSEPQPASRAGSVRDTDFRSKSVAADRPAPDGKPAEPQATGSARSPRVIPDPAEAPRASTPKSSSRSQFDWDSTGTIRANPPRAIEKPRVEDPAPSYSSRQPSRQAAPPDRQDPPTYDSSRDRGRAPERYIPSAPPQQQGPPPSASRSRGGDNGRPPSYSPPPSYAPPSVRNPGPPSAPPSSPKVQAPPPQQSAPPPSAAPPSGKQSGGGGATQSQGSARGGGGGRGKGGDR